MTSRKALRVPPPPLSLGPSSGSEWCRGYAPHDPWRQPESTRSVRGFSRAVAQHHPRLLGGPGVVLRARASPQGRGPAAAQAISPGTPTFSAANPSRTMKPETDGPPRLFALSCRVWGPRSPGCAALRAATIRDSRLRLGHAGAALDAAHPPETLCTVSWVSPCPQCGGRAEPEPCEQSFYRLLYLDHGREPPIRNGRSCSLSFPAGRRRSTISSRGHGPRTRTGVGTWRGPSSMALEDPMGRRRRPSPRPSPTLLWTHHSHPTNTPIGHRPGRTAP